MLACRMGTVPGNPEQKHQAMYLMGSFDDARCSFSPETPARYLDYGMDFYAPQTCLDEAGQRVLIGWMRMPQPVAEKDRSWIGMMTMPRILDIQKGTLFTRPHPKVVQAFQREVTNPLQKESLLKKGTYRITAMLPEGAELIVGGCKIRRRENRILVNRSAVFPEAEEYRAELACPTLMLSEQEEIPLEIYVNQWIMEVYIGHGEYVISSTVYHLQPNLEENGAKQVRLYEADENRPKETRKE
jgi:beta-fructofuranosidase